MRRDETHQEWRPRKKAKPLAKRAAKAGETDADCELAVKTAADELQTARDQRTGNVL